MSVSSTKPRSVTLHPQGVPVQKLYRPADTQSGVVSALLPGEVSRHPLAMTRAPRTETNMTLNRYVIERIIPGIGGSSDAQFCGISEQSNAALAKLAPKVQWIESFIAGDRGFR